MTKIHSTTDYGIFKKHNLNRDVTELHCRKLLAAVKKENLLHLHPIIVNSDYEVISGQHRLEVAKKLKVPVYYVMENVSDEHILGANWDQRRATSTEGLHFYVKKYGENPNYKYLNDLMRSETLSLKGAVGLIFGYKKAFYEDMKIGKLEIPDVEHCNEVVQNYRMVKDHLMTFHIQPRTMWRNFTFTIAFRKCHDLGFNWLIFCKRVNSQWTKIRHQPTVKLWEEHLMKIYNFRARENALSIDLDE